MRQDVLNEINIFLRGGEKNYEQGSNGMNYGM